MLHHFQPLGFQKMKTIKLTILGQEDRYNQKQFESIADWTDYLLTCSDRQGSQRLGGATTGFCCLGIACMIKGWDFDRFLGTPEEMLCDEIRDPALAALWREHYGIDDILASKFATLNDTRRYTFFQIGTILHNDLYDIRHHMDRLGSTIEQYFDEFGEELYPTDKTEDNSGE